MIIYLDDNMAKLGCKIKHPRRTLLYVKYGILLQFSHMPFASSKNFDYVWRLFSQGHHQYVCVNLDPVCSYRLSEVQ
jgi:hypothetical protein